MEEEQVLLPGCVVRLIDLQNAAWLNGLTGTVVGPDVDRPGRWQVDLGEEAGVKALFPKNLVIQEEEDEGNEPGNLIQRLLEERPEEAEEGKMDDVDVIAEALHEVSGKTPEEMDTGMDEAPQVQPENTPSGDAAEVPPEESVAFTKMSIKQLKQFLHCRGVRVPGSITEKADLVALVEESKDLPVRSEEELQRAAEAAKAKEKEAQEAKEAKEAQEAKAAEKPPAAETPESQDTEKPWHMPWQPPDPSTPPGTWNPMHMPHMPGPVPIPQMPNFGLWPPFMPTMPTMPPMSTTVPPAPRVVPPKKNLQWPPKTREEALNFQSNRLMNLRIEPGVLQNLTRFCKFHNLNSEAETALKMLGVDLQSFMSDGTVRANMTGAYDPHHTLIAEVSKRDSQAAYLMRMLLPGPRAPPTCTTSKAAPEKPKPASPERSPVKLRSSQRSSRHRGSRPRHRHSRSHRQKHRHNHRRRSPSHRRHHRRSQRSRSRRRARSRSRRRSGNHRSSVPRLHSVQPSPLNSPPSPPRASPLRASPPKASPPRASPPRASPPTASPPRASPPRASPPREQEESAESSSESEAPGVWSAPPKAVASKAMPKAYPPKAMPQTAPAETAVKPKAKAAPSMAPTIKPSRQDAFVEKVKTIETDDTEKEVAEWLQQLDGGRGALVGYKSIILEEFGSLGALSACVLGKDGSVMSRIDASLWDVLNVKALGHRLLLAKGIVQL